VRVWSREGAEQGETGEFRSQVGEKASPGPAPSWAKQSPLSSSAEAFSSRPRLTRPGLGQSQSTRKQQEQGSKSHDPDPEGLAIM
jgi:hypothetical protein